MCVGKASDALAALSAVGSPTFQDLAVPQVPVCAVGGDSAPWPQLDEQGWSVP